MFSHLLHKTARRVSRGVGTSVIVAAIALAMGFMPWSAKASGTQARHVVGNLVKAGPVTVVADKDSIDLATVEGHSKVTAMSMTYSPDGHYLAIVDAVGAGATHIVVWDLKRNKLQSHTERLTPNFALDPYALLTWTPDGKRLTFGRGGGGSPIKFWDAMTGQVVSEAPSTVVAASLRFNRQGTQALASPGAGGSLTFRVYDTTNWSYKEFDEGGMAVQELAWAPGGRIVAVGLWRKVGDGAAGAIGSGDRDVLRSLKINDVIARLIDPSGVVASRTKLLIPSKPTTVQSGGRYLTYNQTQEQSSMFLVSDAEGKTLAIGLGNILDVPTLEMLTYATSEDISAHKVPAALQPRDFAMSPDGSYLYLGGGSSSPNDGDDNLIVDARTGKLLSGFQGGKGGIAVSPDGTQIAVGDERYVKFFSVK